MENPKELLKGQAVITVTASQLQDHVAKHMNDAASAVIRITNKRVGHHAIMLSESHYNALLKYNDMLEADNLHLCKRIEKITVDAAHAISKSEKSGNRWFIGLAVVFLLIFIISAQ